MDNHFCTLLLYVLLLCQYENMLGCWQKPTVLLTKGHSSVSPHEEFHLEFLCATGLQAVRWLLQRAFTGMDPTV